MHSISHHVRVPVTKKYAVRDATGHALLAEVRHSTRLDARVNGDFISAHSGLRTDAKATRSQEFRVERTGLQGYSASAGFQYVLFRNER